MLQAAQHTTSEFGNVHIVCNNAGVVTSGLLGQGGRADWEKAININLYGVLNGIEAFLPGMKSHGEDGHIINTASMNEPSSITCVSVGALVPGQHGRLCYHEASAPVPPRLRELGFVSGTTISVIRRAPMGDPVEVEIRGTRLCVRRSDLATLYAQPLPSRS